MEKLNKLYALIQITFLIELIMGFTLKLFYRSPLLKEDTDFTIFFMLNIIAGIVMGIAGLVNANIKKYKNLEVGNSKQIQMLYLKYMNDIHNSLIGLVLVLGIMSSYFLVQMFL